VNLSQKAGGFLQAINQIACENKIVVAVLLRQVARIASFKRYVIRRPCKVEIFKI